MSNSRYAIVDAECCDLLGLALSSLRAEERSEIRIAAIIRVWGIRGISKFTEIHRSFGSIVRLTRWSIEYS